MEKLLAAVAQTQGFDDDEPVVSTPSEVGLENSESSPVIQGQVSGSQLIGEVSGYARPVVDKLPPAPATAFPAMGRVIGDGEKRKRGRPPKGQLAAKPPPPKRIKIEDEEEDVCFICFDGGSLVLCDRKGCPKAYHPSCIKRDEAFFKSKAKWNCGWHICSVCRKASHFMCYTCTYSLCKGCTKEPDYVCVRGNKGFCSTCMKTIMLIENKDQATNESVQVDFDDQTSWEYLFKVYWVLLKEKLSLTVSELMQAKKPWKGKTAVASKPPFSNALHTAVGGEVSISYRSTEHVELNKSHVEINLIQNDGLRTALPSNGNHVEKLNSDKVENGPSCSKDTVEPNMDKVTDKTSIDKVTHKTSIGKATDEPGIKGATEEPCIEKDRDDSSSVKDTNKLRICRSTSDKESETPGIDSTQWNSRKRKTRKESEERAPKHDLNEYAAIDVHNIKLIYLRRNLMENLIKDHESFSSSVIGSIVRIRISTHDQKPEVYRLVRVVGTSKVAPYKIGNRTADVMLEVLNLDKKEVVSIDAISNLEFTEDECRALRQCIRCGLMKQFTVGEVQEKALALQSVRVNDCLEAEVLQLNHLRDRASKKGHKKELREYVDRIRQLKSSEQCHLRKSEIPEIHADPKMDPNYESEEDARIGDHSKKGFSVMATLNYANEYVRPTYSPYPQDGRKPISPDKKGNEDQSTEAQNRIIEKIDARGSNSSQKHMDETNIDSSATEDSNYQAMQRCGLGTSTATGSMGNSPSANNIETEKLWHHRDCNGKIQGPFSMMQLREWNISGLFPRDMRIWTNHEQYDSLLLTDALDGKLHGASDLSYKPSSGLQENGATGEIGMSEGTNRTSRDNKQTEVACCNRVNVPSDKNTGHVRADESGSSGWPQCWDLFNDSNSSADDVQAHSLLPSSSYGKRDVAMTNRGQESDEFNRCSQDGQNNSRGLTQNPMTSEHELHNQSNNEDRAGQPSDENLRSIKIDLSSNDMDSVSVFAPVTKSPDSHKQAENIEVLDLLSPNPKTENQQSVSADVPMQESGILELLSPAPRSNNEYPGGQATETKQSEFTNFPLPNSAPGWSGASSLGMGSIQVSEVAGAWCGYSAAPARPSIQQWDSGIVSASSSKPPEVMGENIDTSTSGDHQLAHTSTSQPASNIPNWLAIMNEPIEFDALGEESVSDLLAEVDAMESQGTLPSPTSAMKFARELIEDCKDDCFSSIEEFIPTPEPRRSDALSSTNDIQLTSQSSVPCKPIGGASPVDGFDSFRRSSVHSSASSEGETNAPVHSGDAGSEFHPPAPNTSQDIVGATTAPGTGSDAMDPAWGTVQGNINLVTVQGNVNLVLGGPAQGMANIGWGTNPGTAWANPSINRSPRSGSLPWEGQRKYCGERFTSPREWGYQGSDSGYGRSRPPWGRQPYGGGGYSRPLPKGQRVCKFYESGHCKKGAFCDYLHP